MGPNLQSKDPHLAGVVDRGTMVAIMQILSLVRDESGLAKRIRSLWSAIYSVSPRLEGIWLSIWLQKGMFWVSEQRLVDEANTFRSNSWMT